MSIKGPDILSKYKKPVWKEIQKYIVNPTYPGEFRIPSKYKKDANKYWQIVRDYPLRQGKYLRPTLLLLATEAMSLGYKKAIKTAAAIQLSEEWLLIHDDIQDHSIYRRGKPSLHQLNGIELAIDAGDTLHVLMWKVILDNEGIIGKDKTFEIANEFCQVIKRTADGQAVELMWSNQKKIISSDEDSFFIADGKTAYYTIAAPLRLGAIIAGASNVQLEKISKFGLYLGRCFQIVDDILDLTVNYRGKKQKLGSDIYESKPTLILAHLVRNTKTTDKQKLLRILKKASQDKTEEEVNWVFEKIRECKSIEYAREIANDLKTKSLSILEDDLKFLSHEPARSEIRELITFIVERDK